MKLTRAYVFLLAILTTGAGLFACSGAEDGVSAEPTEPTPSAGGDGDGAGDGASPPGQDGGAVLDAASDAGSDAGLPNVPLPKTFVSKRGKVIFFDDFNSGVLDPSWTVVKGTWKVENQKLVGSSPVGTFDPNIGQMMPLDNAIVQFSFSFTGTGAPGATVNHRGASPAEHQHLLRYRIDPTKTPTAIRLIEMSGWSNTTTFKTLQTGMMQLQPKSTYVGVLEIFGQSVSFSIDGVQIASGTTIDQSATPKNHVVLSAFGESVTYDDVVVWEALAL